jgi:dTDP-4-dehydrorhamnose 3,5-epimerase
MDVLDRPTNGLVLLNPRTHEDERGSFYESFNKRTFEKITGFRGEFVQENHSTSKAGVLRGIHYQLPNPQGKLVRCIEGEIWDLAVDLRKSSPTFKEWRAYELTAENRHQLWIPVGFGHAFLVQSATAQVIYRTTELWDPGCDRAVRWDDSEIGVEWPLEGIPILSDKDSAASSLEDSILFP